MQSQSGSKATVVRRATIITAFTLFVFMAIVLLGWRRDREPEYKGKKLSEWVGLNARRSVGYRAEGGDSEEALRHFGTNALPHLVRWLQYQRPPWKAKLWTVLHSMPVSKAQQRSWSRAAISEMMRGNDAVSAFRTLGEVATPAIPELSRLMFSTRDEQISRRAMESLAGIGAPAVPALSRALTNFAAGESFRDNAVEALAEMEIQALPAVPMLIQWLNDTNQAVASVAVMALGELALWPNVVVPALTNKLQDQTLRRDVIEALGSFETDGASAIPHLLGFLTNSDVGIVAGAASALGDIGEEGDSVAPALAKLLSENPDETVRAAAAASLSQFGDKARPALPILRTALDHPNKDVREAAASVLQAISGNDASTNGTIDVQPRR